MASAHDTVFSSAAVLFDLDGVLTDTAAVHRRAWAELFTGYLPRAAPDADSYTDADYYALIDGKPRDAGVRAVLRSRGIALPDGNDDDPPGTATVAGLGNRKNAAFREALLHDGVDVFPGSLKLLNALAHTTIPLAVVSSSKNARMVLEEAGLLDRFVVVVDGLYAERNRLLGKPDPAMFLAAAAELGAAPDSSTVVEDAISGVAGARAGRFRTIAVDRGVGGAALLAAGADLVVADLAELLPDGGM
ncbi:HAD family hydrolase [Antrihabitans cavernicola]|uniref:Beta-phosphoglucomutase n=1 Tax=Antrihabitans cavernicola TaxID=2495913 RepID=A0A5A7S5X0_9NOCA|nr:beta-phosphoglucomutase family hydrolase [Spelaeibacter cavernicola]KAA0020105.1 beta-phosphoglucomutase family hydrolase [Spelaeibacter cavernicola]